MLRSNPYSLDMGGKQLSPGDSCRSQPYLNRWWQLLLQVSGCCADPVRPLSSSGHALQLGCSCRMPVHCFRS